MVLDVVVAGDAGSAGMFWGPVPTVPTQDPGSNVTRSTRNSIRDRSESGGNPRVFGAGNTWSHYPQMCG